MLPTSEVVAIEEVVAAVAEEEEVGAQWRQELQVHALPNG